MPMWHGRATWHGPGRATLLAGSADWLPFFRPFACVDPFSPFFAGFAWFNLLPARINKTSKNLKEYLINHEKTLKITLLYELRLGEKGM